MSNVPIFAPRDVFDQILEFAVIPTFDLVVEMPDGGVVLVWRKIAPYKNVWALPGLRMYKNESIEQTMERIVSQELGISIDASQRQFLGQYVGKFTTEHNRQDLSTGYVVKSKQVTLLLNDDHFSRSKLIYAKSDIPKPIGAMYAFYLKQYFENRK